MNNTEILINALSKRSGGGGGDVEVVFFGMTFDELNKASSSGKRVVFDDGITINTPLVPEVDLQIYFTIEGMNYIDLTDAGGGEQYCFHTVYDATDNPNIGKLMSITVACADNDVWSTRVTYIDAAT